MKCVLTLLTLFLVCSCQTLPERQQKLERELGSPGLGNVLDDASEFHPPLARALLTYAEGVVRVNKDYERAMDKAGIETLLSPTRLALDTSYQESAKMMSHLRKLVDTHEARQKQVALSYPEVGKRAGLKGVYYRGFSRGISESLKETRSDRAKSWQFERRVLDQVEEAMLFLHRDREAWYVENGEFRFWEKSDLKKYQKIQRKLAALAKEGERFQAEMKRKAEQA